jgi:hypothetical protein
MRKVVRVNRRREERDMPLQYFLLAERKLQEKDTESFQIREAK